jgi:outer membrane immunogenic protein
MHRLVVGVGIVTFGFMQAALGAPADKTHSWSGFYFGGNIGAAVADPSNTLTIGNVSYFANAAVPGVNATGSFSDSASGFIGGPQIGYNYQIGNALVGVEADFSWLHAAGSRSGGFIYTTNASPYDLSTMVSASWLATARGRIGYAMDRNLFYVTGGVALSALKFDQHFSEKQYFMSIAASKTRVGWAVGGGWERDLNGNWSIKAEYLFVRFSDQDFAGTLADQVVGRAEFSNSAGLDLHLARLGLNYRFDDPAAAAYAAAKGAALDARAWAGGHNWSGLYVGVNGGAAVANIGNTLSIANSGFFAQAAIAGVDATGTFSNITKVQNNGPPVDEDRPFTVGAQLGYNYQTGNAVYGFEADFNWLHSRAGLSGGFGFTTSNSAYSLSTTMSANWLATVRGRLGYAMDRNLFYVTGGVALSALKFDQVYRDGPYEMSVTASKTRVGWAAGGGWERDLNGNWSIRAEYLFVQFNDVDVVGTVADPFAGRADFNNTAKHNLQLARLGLNYRFGDPAASSYAGAGASGYAARASAGPHDWSGFYAGANGGAAVADTGNTLSITNAGFFAPAAIAGVEASGTFSNITKVLNNGPPVDEDRPFTVSAQLGYNYQTGNAVYGIEADFNWLHSRAGLSGGFGYTTSNSPYTLSTTISADWLATVRGRLGYAMDRSLFYVTGGIAVAAPKFDQTFISGPVTMAASSSTVRAGLTAGGGWERALTDNWSVKAEYLFVHFNDLAITGTATFAGTYATFNNTTDLDLHIARLGLNYRFNGRAARN